MIASPLITTSPHRTPATKLTNDSATMLAHLHLPQKSVWNLAAPRAAARRLFSSLPYCPGADRAGWTRRRWPRRPNYIVLLTAVNETGNRERKEHRGSVRKTKHRYRCRLLSWMDDLRAVRSDTISPKGKAIIHAGLETNYFWHTLPGTDLWDHRDRIKVEQGYRLTAVIIASSAWASRYFRAAKNTHLQLDIPIWTLLSKQRPSRPF